MALNGCVTAVVTAVVALLLLPAQYYVPDLSAVEHPLAEQPKSVVDTPAWFHSAPLDLYLQITLLLLVMITYLCEWIQRKLIERRIVKLNQYLAASVERLRARDAEQEQLEVTLTTVQNATAEYNLLLYLLLQRQHRAFAPTTDRHRRPKTSTF